MIGCVVERQVNICSYCYCLLSAAAVMLDFHARFYVSMFGTVAPFTSPLEPLWVGFTLEETEILKGNTGFLGPVLLVLCISVLLFVWY